ncbi:MAG: chorismate mutase [Clostridia bacterium]|nr:chorismate mutase [Clostridia bacterium]
MNDLEKAREAIGEIDKEMAALFEKRMAAAARIADYKRKNGLSVKDEEREKALIEKNCSFLTSADLAPYYTRFLEEIISVSCDYQEKLLAGMRVAYSGTLGAFAYMAAKKMFPSAEPVAYSDFTEAYMAVERGEADVAVLPLENSYAGEVGEVMNLIFSGSLYINQVIEMPIVHHLIAQKGATKEGIKKVFSHPQALEQCADYIEKNGFAIQPFSNTALAAEYIRDSKDLSEAAIASEETASLFSLQILDSGIQDSKTNTTRFAAFTKEKNVLSTQKKKENENFILVFTVQNKAGSLANALNILGAHGYNMRNLRSRPMKNLEWSYFFYMECEGSIHTENGDDMLKELSAVCAHLKLAGAYRVPEL